MSDSISIYCDGGARGNPGSAASAFVVMDTINQILHEQGIYLGIATNNQAEYQAVIESLKWLLNTNTIFKQVNFYLDSELVVRQLTGVYKIKDQTLKGKSLEIVDLIRKLPNTQINFSHVYREKNSRADFLVNQTLDSQS